MKVAFAGTPEFASQAMSAIAKAGFAIPLVLTQPDRPAGRGMKLQASPVKQLALTLNVPVYQPVSLRKGEDGLAAIEALRTCCDGQPPDVMVVAAYGLILPQHVLDIPRLGCLNIHASLLPRWRGAAPIHRAIEAGDTETGITIMQMDAGLDTGDMLQIHRCAIDPSDTTAVLHDRLAQLGGEAIVSALQALTQARLTPTPQPQEGVTYAHKIAKEESHLNWTDSAISLTRKLNAFDPFPGGLALIEPVNSDDSSHEAIKLWAGHPLAGASMHKPGTVLEVSAQGLDVQCGDGVLRITEVQRPGGKRMAMSQVWQSLTIKEGDCLVVPTQP